MNLVLAVLGASLLGSPHCAAMCGGFVCFYAGDAAGSRRGTVGHAAYNLGRLLSYVLLGTVAGFLGARLDEAGDFAGVQRAAAVVAGALMVGWGLSRIAAAYGVRVPGLGGPPLALQRRLGGLLRAVGDRPLVVRAAALGLVTTLLPCGWLWTFVLTAAGTASPLTGALVMATFWLGTLPVMTALGVGVQRAAGPFRRRLPVISAAVLVVLGSLSLAGKLQVGPLAGRHAHDPTHDQAHDPRAAAMPHPSAPGDVAGTGAPAPSPATPSHEHH